MSSNCTSLVVVVLAVVGCADDAGALLGVGPDEVDLRVVVDLVVLVRRQLVHVQLHHLLGRRHHRLGLDRAVRRHGRGHHGGRAGRVGRIGRAIGRGRADGRRAVGRPDDAVGGVVLWALQRAVPVHHHGPPA